MSAPQITKAKLTSKFCHHEEICEFQFEMEKNLNWIPGQFAMITINDGQTPPAKRAYSIASSPKKSPHISFIVKRVPNGRGTTWLFDEVEEGAEVELMLPLGHMTLEDNHEEILLIATGIGIPPMLSIIDDLAYKKFPVPTRLVFGSRFEGQLCRHGWLEELATKHENFEYIPCVSRPDEHWMGHMGRANTYLEQMDIDFSKQSAFICGSPEVAKDLREQIVSQGVKEDNVKLEAF